MTPHEAALAYLRYVVSRAGPPDLRSVTFGPDRESSYVHQGALHLTRADVGGDVGGYGATRAVEDLNDDREVQEALRGLRNLGEREGVVEVRR